MSMELNPRVKMMSSLTGEGMDDVWEAMQKFNSVMAESGHKSEKRAVQRQKWMWAYINSRLLEVSTSKSSKFWDMFDCLNLITDLLQKLIRPSAEG